MSNVEKTVCGSTRACRKNDSRWVNGTNRTRNGCRHSFMKEADFYVGIGYGDIAEAFGKVLSGLMIKFKLRLPLFIKSVSLRCEHGRGRKAVGA